MQPRSRRFAAAVFGMGVAVLLAAPRASADLLPDRNSKWLDRKFVVLRAGRFDPYCEHRREIPKGDTFESIAKSAYGDAKRAKEIAAANPTLEAERLPVGVKIVLPPKEAPPKDVSETLAWEFWIYGNISGYIPLQRVYPGESLRVESKFPVLVAVPAARHDDFAKLISEAKAKDPAFTARVGGECPMPDTFVDQTPWVIKAKNFYVDASVLRSLPAVEGTSHIRVVDLVATTTTPGRFVVDSSDVEYRDRAGNVVHAGFDLLLSWRGIPLGLIVLVGYLGLRRMRRARGGVAAS